MYIRYIDQYFFPPCLHPRSAKKSEENKKDYLFINDSRSLPFFPIETRYAISKHLKRTNRMWLHKCTSTVTLVSTVLVHNEKHVCACDTHLRFRERKTTLGRLEIQLSKLIYRSKNTHMLNNNISYWINIIRCLVDVFSSVLLASYSFGIDDRWLP